MKFTFFEIKNYKGIENERIDLKFNSINNVYTLVGLNESGKTTVLEAINFFVYKPEDLKLLGINDYETDDIHNLIPINKRDNFNGKISIKAGLKLDDDDIEEIKIAFKKKDIILGEFDGEFAYIQEYVFENSKAITDKNKQLWTINISGKKGKARTFKKLSNEDALIAHKVIQQRLPSILYFPNFLFEFPDKIYLTEDFSDTRHKFYRQIIQDVLDSLENDTNIQNHLIDRSLSNDSNDKRNLTSLLGKMQKQLTNVIFAQWNQIFNKEFYRNEIILLCEKDDNGVYIEFNIKDDVDTYRINERSLGFRWFFVYILFTHFRTFRKNNKNILFLFDEPASNLHPSAQSELLKSFEKLSNVIYTTHSHYLINPKWLENTYVIKNDAIDYSDEINFLSKNTNIKIHKYRTFAIKHPNQSNYFQPILEVLDYRPSNLEYVPNALITEGKNDYYSLLYFKEVILNDKTKFSIIPGTSCSNLDTLISLYLGWGKNFIALLDSDKEGIIQQKRYNDLFGLEGSNSILTYQDISPEWQKISAEKLFSKEDQLRIIQEIDPSYQSNKKFDKKIFNRSIQELFINKIKIEFDKETIEKFRLIFKTIKDKLKN